MSYKWHAFDQRLRRRYAAEAEEAGGRRCDDEGGVRYGAGSVGFQRPFSPGLSQSRYALPGSATVQGKVLVVEDDRAISDLLRMYLEKEGVEVTVKDSAEGALPAIEQDEFDLLLLDVNLPGRDGFELLADLRRRHDLPVLVLTARDAEEDSIFAFGVGADDYVTKPFSPKVLTARVRAHLRRRRASAEAAEPVLRYGPLAIDPDGYAATLDGRPLNLARREFELLALLAASPGQVFTAEQIYDRVWGNRFGDLSTVTVHVQRIRKKLGDGGARWVQTVRGVGYRFNPTPEESA